MRTLPDPLTRRAADIFGVPCDKVTPKMRDYAKTVAYTENYAVSQQMVDFLAGYKQRAAAEAGIQISSPGNRQ